MGRSAELTWLSSDPNAAENPPLSPTGDPENDELRELSFGLYLRRERILRGISREEVLQVTKVSPEYIDALESNQFDHLPPKAFVLGFLRVFAEYAGLDENEVSTRYLSEVARQQELRDGEAAHHHGPFWRRHLARILGALGFVCLVSLMFAPLFARK